MEYTGGWSPLYAHNRYMEERRRYVIACLMVMILVLNFKHIELLDLQSAQNQSTGKSG